MNKNLVTVIYHNFEDCGETGCAEIFNIFANNPERLSWDYDLTEYIFNIMDNRQAAKAVRMFGFETVAEASKENWIIKAKKNEEDKWEFSNVSPSEQVMKQIEEIILDIVLRPRDYPVWVWELINKPLEYYLMHEACYQS